MDSLGWIVTDSLSLGWAEKDSLVQGYLDDADLEELLGESSVSTELLQKDFSVFTDYRIC